MNVPEISRFIEECKAGLTLERLKRLLHYNPATGEFTRLIRTAHRVKVGDIAGSKATNGYMYICLPDKKYLAHRLAMFYMTGAMPKEVDHINGDRTDNRFCNLREVTRSQNNQNQHNLRSDNTSGVRGVTYEKRRGLYMAQVALHGKTKFLGYYKTIEEATTASVNGRKLIHPYCEKVKAYQE